MIPIGPSEPALPLRRIFPLSSNLPPEIARKLDDMMRPRR